MANPELGAKQICPNCQAKFYDLTRRPAHCPKCAHEFDPDEAVRSRRTRSRVAPTDHEVEEDGEAQVRGKSEADDEDEEDEVVTPELDEVVDAPIIPGDDDDDDVEPGAAPEDELAGFSEDEEDLEEDTDDVPFLEDEEDDFDDTEIEGLPGEGDVEDR